MRVLLCAFTTGCLAITAITWEAGRVTRASNLTLFSLVFAMIAPMVAVPGGAWIGALFSKGKVWPISGLFSQIGLAAMGCALTALSTYLFFCVTSFVHLQNGGNDPKFIDLVLKPALHVPLEEFQRDYTLKRDISVGTLNRWLFVGMGGFLGACICFEISRKGWKRKSRPRADQRRHRRFEIFEKLQAPRDQPLNVWFEPWAAGLTFSPGTTVELRATATTAGRLQIKHQDEGVTVYGWSGCTLEVIIGCEIVEEFHYIFPELPPGMEMEEFVNLLFGPPPENSGIAYES